MDKYLSSFAVDGNFNTTLGGGSCSLTSSTGDINPWMGIDLGGLYYVLGVLVTNRADGFGEFVHVITSLAGYLCF